MAEEATLGDEMADDIKQIKAELKAALAEKQDLREKLQALESAHVQLQTSHKEMMSKHGIKEHKSYVYGEHECRPIGQNETCDVIKEDGRPCGWEFNTQLRKGREKEGRQPHPVA